MKINGTIPKKVSNHSQGSVARPERDQHKAYFTIKPILWDKEKDTQIKCKPLNVKAGKPQDLRKSCINCMEMSHRRNS